MIPWCIVSLIAGVLRPFGLQAMAVATKGRRGADRVHVVRPGQFAEASLLTGIEPAKLI